MDSYIGCALRCYSRLEVCRKGRSTRHLATATLAVSLQSNSIHLADSTDNEATRAKPVSERLTSAPISQNSLLPQRKIGLYQNFFHTSATRRKAKLVETVAAVVTIAGAPTQPVFEQRGAVLVPNDEVLMEFGRRCRRPKAPGSDHKGFSNA